MADSLHAVVSQRLLPRKDGHGRAAALEIMLVTGAIRDLIVDPTRTAEIREYIADGREQYGMQTFDQHLMDLVADDHVDFSTAMANASNPSDFELQMKTLRVAPRPRRSPHRPRGPRPPRWSRPRTTSPWASPTTSPPCSSREGRCAGRHRPDRDAVDATSGEVAPVILRQVSRALLAAGIDGIAVAGSTGEGELLDEAEKIQLVEWLRDVVPDDRWLIAGTGAESTRAAIRMAAAAGAAGADAVLVRPPAYFGGIISPAQFAYHYASLADASPVPVIIYNIPKYNAHRDPGRACCGRSWITRTSSASRTPRATSRTSPAYRAAAPRLAPSWARATCSIPRLKWAPWAASWRWRASRRNSACGCTAASRAKTAGRRRHAGTARPAGARHRRRVRAGRASSARWRSSASAAGRCGAPLSDLDARQARPRGRYARGRRPARRGLRMFGPDLKCLVVVGAQWGDEGKGKVVDALAEHAALVVRYQGGANAGHTVDTDAGEFILQQIPSGILHPRCRCVIGNGVVLDPETLFQEIDALAARQVLMEGRLAVSDRAHLVLPYHKTLDRLSERSKKIGTTARRHRPGV